MQFTTTRVAASVALALGVFTASNSQAARPEAIATDAAVITPARMPAGLTSAPVTVILQLNGNSVAEQQGAAGRRLSRAEKDSAKGQLRAQQEGLRPSIEAAGGSVLANYQSAFNGIKVRIARSAVASLASLPGVVAVRPVQLHRPTNIRGIPFIGAPSAWGNLNLHGEGVKIAIIDTGIDYTHADFGGPGTAAAYTLAHASETSPADPALFGPLAPRVKGGTDLVGDSYDADPQSATYQPVPHPDPNPLDCNGHGSHVAGTAAGSGVLSNGQSYFNNPDGYNATTVSSHTWNVGPGVAPKADIYAVRVFGCSGSTDVVVDAIDWAVDNDMDVISMSLGSDLGTADTSDAIASTNAAKAGIIVVAAAGNAGGNQYILSSPAAAEGAIAAAANDSTPLFPGVSLPLSTGATVTAINANGVTSLPSGSLPIHVLKTSTGGLSLGCNPAEYAGSAGKIVVTLRGTCARVARAIYGQQAGAAAVVMVNTSDTFPPFEGQITSNPDTGQPYTVTIPFLGVRSSSRTTMLAADNGSSTLIATQINNPTFKAYADFSSSGPRIGDSHLKPDITAPGVSIVSVGMGTGNAAVTESGTSMATPHTSGSAALTRQAHPNWRGEDLKSAIVNTGDPSLIAVFRASRGGTGEVQPASAAATQVVARTSGGKFGAALNFGFSEFRNDYSRSQDVTLRNLGNSAATFNVAEARASGSPHTVALSASSVTVPAGDEATVSVTLNVPAATAGASNGAGLSFQEVAGLIEFTPQGSDNGGVTLRVPYYLVPRVQSGVSTSIGRLSGTNPTTTATVTNKNGAIPGDADFYAWGISAAQSSDQTNQTNDVRAVGVQSFQWDATRQLIVFAVNNYNRWSSPSVNEFDIYVDVDNDGTPDYVVVGFDQGAITTGAFSGTMGSFVFSLRSNGASEAFLAAAPSDSSTIELPIFSSQLCRTGEPCLNAANPRFTYQIVSFDLLNGGTKAVAGTARFNAWTNAVSSGGFATVAPGGTDTSNTIAVNSGEAAKTPALGLMVVTFDNKSGADEAQLIPVTVK